nr:16S rRNA (adenine(1518)-N(6)/adenine(1519)-N(6))-dimethyltransferase RsmA [Kiritimatiella glycovorans]
MRELDLRPSRGRGQNFLIDANILRCVIDSAGLEDGDGVLEIGPGLGALTAGLLERGGRVTAIEKDGRLADHLRRLMPDRRALHVRTEDALETDFGELFRASVCRVAANLPYSVGTRILVRIVDAEPRPETVAVMLQLETARRIAAAPGSSDYGPLAVRTTAFFESALVKTVSATCFYPRPEVRSAVLRLVRRDTPAIRSDAYPRLVEILRSAFSQRRKKLSNTLPDLDLRAVGIDPELRPHRVPPGDWYRLAERALHA